MTEATHRDAALLSRAPRAGRSILRNPFIWAFLVGIMSLTLVRPFLRHVPEPPPVLGQLPDYRLVDADGRPFGSDELAGEVYVAGFMFTRSASPRLAAALRELHARFDDSGIDVRLVGFTVDPEFDTPERLRAYGASPEVDFDRWTLLTGERVRMERLVVGGFGTPMGAPEIRGSDVDVAHTGKLVLIDGRGRIRGYYDSDLQGIDEVFYRAQHVLAERAKASD